MVKIITEKHREDSLRDFKTLLSIPSVLDETQATETMPLGPSIDEALTHTLEICERLDMRTYRDPEGYYGYAEVGEGEGLVGLVLHLDVVPPGDLSKWDTNPFNPVEKDGNMYARGSQDDKGPVIASIYALKAIMDAGYEFTHRVRLIFGTDEETYWRGIDRYNELEEQPDVGFVPDGMFPLVYAEKGLWQARISGPGSTELKLEIGDAPNVVPSRAVYAGEKLEEVASVLEKTDATFEKADETVTVEGVSVHASRPELGDNAVMRLIRALNEVYDEPLLKFLTEKVGSQTNGENLFGQVSDNVSGELTLNVGNVYFDDEQSYAVIDMRYPVKTEISDLEKRLVSELENTDLNYSKDDAIPPLHKDVSSDLVQTLLKVYRNHTDDMTEPFVVGGATYARKMENMVTFGPHFSHTPSLAHQENEFYPLEDMYKAMEIYSEAIIDLACQ